MKAQLDRFGNTDFRVADISVQWTQPWFVPASLINRLRWEAVTALETARLAAHVRLPRRPAAEPPAPYPAETLSYLANVYNHAARRFSPLVRPF